MMTVLLGAFLAVVPRPVAKPATIVTHGEAVSALAQQVERAVRSGAASVVDVDLTRELVIAASENQRK